MALNIQTKTYTYPSSLLQASKWDMVRDSWLATAKVWFAPPKDETDTLIFLIVTLIQGSAAPTTDGGRFLSNWINAKRRIEFLQNLIKMLEKPSLCFFMLHRDDLCLPLISSCNTSNAYYDNHFRLLGDETMTLEKELLTTITCFGFCRHIFELSEQIYATEWQPWMDFTLPDLEPFVPGAYMPFEDHLTDLSLRSAQTVRELTTFLLKGSHGIRYIEELSIIHRIGLLLHFAQDVDAYQELLNALQGLVSALCLTKKGMNTVIAAVGSKKKWRRSLCRVNFSHGAIEKNWINGKGLLHYAFEIGLEVDMPEDGDEHESKLLFANRVVMYEHSCATMGNDEEFEPEASLVAKVHTKVYGAVLCESLNALVEAEALFKKVDDLGQELRQAFRQATCESERRKLRKVILEKMAKSMWRLAMLCMWEYGREAVYIAGRHLGSLDYIARIVRYVGNEFSGKYARWFNQDYPHLYHAARVVYLDMVTMGRAFEPLMAMHPDSNAQFVPQILLLNDFQGRLTNMDEQLHFLCAAIDKPHKLLDPDFVGHLETVINSMTTSSMHSASYLKTLFTRCIEMRIKMSLPTLLSIALNEVVKSAYLAAAISSPPSNYVPGSSYGLKANKAPTYDTQLFQRDHTTEKDQAYHRRSLINKCTAALRLVCSLTALLRRTVKCLYGNTSAGVNGVMSLGESTHGVFDEILEESVATVKEPFDKWPSYFEAKLAYIKEGSPEDVLGGNFITIMEDAFKQWTVGRVVFEALLNAYSVGADKALLRNKPLVELMQEVCGRSIKMLLDHTFVEDRKGETILKPKYLGRNGAFYLLAHIIEDAIYKHRVSPLENNAKLLQEVMPLTFLGKSPTLDGMITLNAATEYWVSKLELLGPALGKLLELWVGFRIPTGIKLLDGLSVAIDRTSLKLDISNTEIVPMYMDKIAEWIFDNNTTIPKSIQEEQKAKRHNLVATEILAKARQNAAAANNVRIVRQSTIPVTNNKLQPAKERASNPRANWKSRNPTPQQLQHRTRPRALPRAPTPASQLVPDITPAILITPAFPRLVRSQLASTPVQTIPSNLTFIGQDSIQLATPAAAIAPHNLNSSVRDNIPLATPATPAPQRNITPSRQCNELQTAPCKQCSPGEYSKQYYSYQAAQTILAAAKVSPRSTDDDQFQKPHEHHEQA